MTPTSPRGSVRPRPSRRRENMLLAALRYYADRENWHSDRVMRDDRDKSWPGSFVSGWGYVPDEGRVARAALAALGEESDDA